MVFNLFRVTGPFNSQIRNKGLPSNITTQYSWLVIWERTELFVYLLAFLLATIASNNILIILGDLEQFFSGFEDVYQCSE